MWWTTFQDSDYYGLVLASGIFALWLLIAVVTFFVLRFIAKRLTSRTPGSVGALAIRALRPWTVAFLVLLGAVLAARVVPELDAWDADIARAWNVAVILLVAQGFFSVSRVVLTWYIEQVAPRTESSFDDQALRLVRRVLRVFVYGIALLLVMDTLGQSISPILGGLGITGLAVALALQPTLSNFFAGTYVLSDGAIRPGDYIELTGGTAGYVIEVGWRTTKLRTWWNTLVIVPNSLMSDTIITNYQGPDPAINVLVTCGVSYSSDLDKVEAVTLEVARNLIAENPDAIKTVAPWFAFDSFADSNVNFWIFLQAKDRIGSFVITNEIIKRLHARFQAEGIEINYPVRKVIFSPDHSPPFGIADQGGQTIPRAAETG